MYLSPIGFRDIMQKLTNAFYNLNWKTMVDWWNDHDSGRRQWSAFSASVSTASILPISAVSSAVNQTANIGSTNLYASALAGTYRVSVYLVDSTADVTAGTVTATIAYTDSVQAQTVSTVAVALTVIGTFTQSTFFIQVANATNIAYSTSHTGIFGTAKYNVYITLERLN